jgi:hypothetical protein
MLNVFIEMFYSGGQNAGLGIVGLAKWTAVLASDGLPDSNAWPNYCEYRKFYNFIFTENLN